MSIRFSGVRRTGGGCTLEEALCIMSQTFPLGNLLQPLLLCLFGPSICHGASVDPCLGDRWGLVCLHPQGQ